MNELVLEYLDKVGQYEALRVSSGEAFEKGFLDLATANYRSGSQRYGRDYYDNRVKATIVCKQGKVVPVEGHDPLHMFGVLVPPSLRQAQSQFSQALRQAVEARALVQKIEVLEQRIRQQR